MTAIYPADAGWRTRIDAVLKDWVVARQGQLPATVASARQSRSVRQQLSVLWQPRGETRREA